MNESAYICNCLNVRITSQPITPSKGDPVGISPGYHPVYVGDEGISIAHTLLTVRTNSKATSTEDPSIVARHVSLSCLICGLEVYRVSQVIPAASAGKEGPIVSTDNWIEREILISTTGWIEVHKSCLTGAAVNELEGNMRYSALLNVVIPDLPRSPVENAALTDTATSSPSTATRRHLPSLPPVLHPPPFTPSHPVYIHLASIASRGSDEIRSEAEERLAKAVAAEVTNVARLEAELRKYVETLWTRYRESVAFMAVPPPPKANRADSGAIKATVSPLKSDHAFVPDLTQSVPRPRTAPAPRISGLSASLRESSFHHPKQHSSESSHSFARDGAAPAVSTPVGNGTSNESAVPFLRRNMDPVNDTATSFRYFTIEEMDQERKRTDATANQQTKSSTTGEPLSSVSEGKRRLHLEQNPNRTRPKDHDDSLTPGGNGKRKVTFDVSVESPRRLNGVKSPSSPDKEPEEMIFVLEDSVDAPRPASSDPPVPSAPIRAPVRQARNRNTSWGGLPESLSSLRPASLPVASNVRTPPQRDPPPVASPPSIPVATPQPPPTAPEIDGSPVTSQDAEILRLVAADTPSHRGAWNKDSKAWQTFVRRHDDRPSDTENILTEDSDEDSEIAVQDDDHTPDGNRPSWEGKDYYRGFVGSLPVSIVPLMPPKEVLSLASYQPQTILSSTRDSLPDSRQALSPTTRRKAHEAAYAERDSLRSLDPGALDFAAEADDEEDEDEENTRLEGDRGRRRALNILRAAQKEPDSGMWRSLA